MSRIRTTVEHNTNRQQPIVTSKQWHVAGPLKNLLELVISPASDTFQGQPTARTYEVLMTGVLPATSVQVTGKKLQYAPYLGMSHRFAGEPTPNDSFSYSGTTLSVVVYADKRDILP